MKEKIKNFRFELIAMVLWLAGVITIAAFHEPWFDEIQAWQIARTATWHDLFLEVPHSECHPFLWHLLLRPFALAGLPFEPVIKTINILLTASGCALILFKSKMPKSVRLFIPFTFMIFYQTAIINRSYSVLFLGFVLLGLTRKKRDEKPLPYVVTMAVMCLTHVMGIMMCGLLCIVWVCQIICEYRADKSKGNIFKDKRVFPLAALFVFAVVIMIMIFPSTENTNFDPSGYLSDAKSILYNLSVFLELPFETTFSPTQFKSGIVVASLFFVLINAFMIYFCRKNKCVAEYFVPYIIFSLFYAFIWNWHHMMQIYYYFFIYIFIAFASEDMIIVKELMEKIKDPKLNKAVKLVITGVFMIMPACAAASAYKDIRYTYFDAKEISAFIKDNGLEDLRIFGEWTFSVSQSQDRDEEQNISNDFSSKEIDPYTDVTVRNNLYAIATAAYFDHMIIANSYDPGRDREYANYRITTEEDRRNCYEKLSKEPYPDIIIGRIDVLDTIYGKDVVESHHFKLVYRTYNYFTWKFDSTYYGYETVWMREDLLEQYGIKEVPPDYNTVE